VEAPHSAAQELDKGQADRAIDFARQALRIDRRLYEPAQRQILTALRSCGREGAAAGQYRLLREGLREEFGVSPEQGDTGHNDQPGKARPTLANSDEDEIRQRQARLAGEAREAMTRAGRTACQPGNSEARLVPTVN
jgi:hypothetical protein